jgi:hypothetical protein
MFNAHAVDHTGGDSKPLSEIRFDQSFGGPRDHVAAHEFADLGRRVRAGLDSRADAADVTANHRGHQSAANSDALHDLYIGGLGHRIGRLNEPDEASCFYESNCVLHDSMFLEGYLLRFFVR